MKSLINFYDGKIIHQRLGKTKHKFTNLHLFLLINISKISSLTDASYRLKSYERGVAQLGSAGALGAYLFTNKNDCNN